MASERFEMRFPTDLMERVDSARGHEPRASFVKRMVEAALSGEAKVLVPPERKTPVASGASAPNSAGPPRASVTHIGCERHPEAGAYQGANGNWWCADRSCTKAARTA